MANPWLPSKDLDLQVMAGDVSTKITATPGAFGLLALDASGLASLVSGFNAAMALSTDPATRTKVTIIATQTAKQQLIADIRALAKRIQANPAVSPAQKTSLGLPVHNLNPSPTPAPASKPVINIRTIGAAELTIGITDETTPTRRARPNGTIGAQIFSFVGAAGITPPADLEQWTFKGMATQANYQIAFTAADAGKQAYIIARWTNRKGETGPSSLPTVGPIAA
jgi:hypothetical protein